MIKFALKPEQIFSCRLLVSEPVLRQDTGRFWQTKKGARNKRGKNGSQFTEEIREAFLLFRAWGLMALLMAAQLAAGPEVLAASGKPGSRKAAPQQSYYTRAELESLYRKKYAAKIPYNFKFGRITEVQFADDGTVYVTAVANPLYAEMPRFARMMLFERYWRSARESYCRKVAQKKAPYSRVRRTEGDFYDDSGRTLHHVTFYPGMCSE